MIDCSTTEEEKNIFIKKFIIKEDYILVLYANGETEKVKKNLKNYEKLIAKMKSQIKDLERMIEIKKDNYLTGLISSYFRAVALIFGLFPMHLNPNLIIAFLEGCIIFLFFKGIKTSETEYEEYESVKEEFQKFQMYLDNQEALEAHTISKDIINEINISKKTVRNRSLDGNININLIDAMSLDDLKKIVSYLNKLRDLTLERIEVEEPGYQKTIRLMQIYDLKNNSNN